MLDRLRDLLPWSHSPYLTPHRRGRLLRSTASLAVVIAVAGAAGILLGVGISALTGRGGDPPAGPGVPTTSTPAGPVTARLPIEVTSTTVRPAANGATGATVSVRVRIENASGRTVQPEPPRLLVDEVRVAAQPDSADTTGGLLAATLRPGDVAEGTLRFNLRSRTASELTRARVRLRLASKFVLLSPVLDETTDPG